MSEYDESIVFVNINQLLQFVNETNTIDGLNVRIKNPKDIDELTQYLDLNLLYPLNYITWKDKNSSLYKWIKVQKLPNFANIRYNCIRFFGEYYLWYFDDNY